MEAFKVFATLSLVDLMSGPLARVRAGMADVDAGAAGLTARFGRLAASMGPLAVAGGVVLGAFGKCVATAASFEDQMAKVGAVSRASESEMQALEAKARELGATTQFTASQVAQGEQYLAMAGFSVEQNLAALPAVLNLAAATATDLGRAADISSDILGAFGMKAEEMTRVADTLALTCAQANVDMELLGDTMKYVAPVAKKASLSLEETAAMAGLLGDVGIKGSQAGTTMKAMLGKLAAPTKEATDLLKNLGIATKDAQGNLRSPIKVLGELGEKLKNMGSADQISAIKKIVGEEAMAGFSELTDQAGGAGKLVEKLGNLLKGEGTAAEMARRQNDTLAGDMRGLGSAFESVQISIGKIFIPVLRLVVQAITTVMRWFDKLAQSAAGQFFLKLAAAAATVVVGITAFSAAMWGIGKLMPLITGALAPVKAALLGLGAPFWAIIALAGVLYVAWKNNFGGIATTLARWGRNIKLIFDGVCAVFATLNGSTGEIRGELAKEIKAAGLVGLVTTVGKICFRIREFFAGIWSGLDFSRAIDAFMPAVQKIRALFDKVGDAVSRIFGGGVSSAASEAMSLGEIVGGALSWSLESLATVISAVVSGIENLISFVRMICAIFIGDWATAIEMARSIWTNLVATFMSFVDLFRLGDWIDAACASATDILNGMVETVAGIWNSIVSGVSEFGTNLLAGITGAWNSVLSFFDGLNLFESGAKLLTTFIDGIKSMAGSVVDSVTGVLGKIRNLLPFSDAKEGPLSTLTLSGSRMMTTIAEGVNQGKDALAGTVTGALGEAGRQISGFRPEIDALSMNGKISAAPESPAISIPEAPAVAPEDTVHERGHQEGRDAQNRGQTITITIGELNLPDVTDADGFLKSLQTVLQAEIGGLEGA